MLKLTLGKIGLLVILGLSMVSFYPQESWPADEKTTVSLMVADVLGMPGKPVMLRARLFEDRVLGAVGLGGEQVSFEVDGQPAGTAMTGGDGRVFLEFTAHMRGNHQITASVGSSPRVKDTEGNGTLASWERRKPILLVDLVALIQEGPRPDSLLPALSLALEAKLLGDPEEHAAKELGKLGKFYYNLLYLVRGDSGDVVGVREWLRTHEFPVGLIKSIDPGQSGLTSVIETLKEGGWDNLSAGVGRTKEFAEVLVKNRLLAVILPRADSEEEFPRRAKVLTNWKELRKHL